ncbi:hypothetical protein JCM18750_34630 [Halostagnicola bangensis]
MIHRTQGMCPSSAAGNRGPPALTGIVGSQYVASRRRGHTDMTTVVPSNIKANYEGNMQLISLISTDIAKYSQIEVQTPKYQLMEGRNLSEPETIDIRSRVIGSV